MSVIEIRSVRQVKHSRSWTKQQAFIAIIPGFPIPTLGGKQILAVRKKCANLGAGRVVFCWWRHIIVPLYEFCGVIGKEWRDDR